MLLNNPLNLSDEHCKLLKQETLINLLLFGGGEYDWGYFVFVIKYIHF